jgi:hypothetical protein
MDSDAAHLTTESQVQNPLEQVTMQITQNMLPNLNFMTTSFPLNDMSLNGQAAVLQSLQQLGAVPFFTQGGGQLLMQAAGVPVLLHPGFGGTIQQQIASTSQTGNSQMVAQSTDSVVETLRTSGLQIDSSLLQSLLQQQQQQFPLLNLSQLYAQQQNIDLATNDHQDSNQTNDSSFNVVSSQAFLEPYNTQLSGFTAPLAYTAASQSTPVPVSENSEYASAGSNISQKPPKKPLTPYMRFSKEVQQCICCYQIANVGQMILYNIMHEIICIQTFCIYRCGRLLSGRIRIRLCVKLVPKLVNCGVNWEQSRKNNTISSFPWIRLVGFLRTFHNSA